MLIGMAYLSLRIESAHHEPQSHWWVCELMPPNFTGGSVVSWPAGRRQPQGSPPSFQMGPVCAVQVCSVVIAGSSRVSRASTEACVDASAGDALGVSGPAAVKRDGDPSG